MHWRRKWQPTPVFLPGESQGQQSLVGCRLWGHTELDTTEATAAAAAAGKLLHQLHILKVPASNAGDLGSIPGLGRPPGEGNGNPLQCSCLENPRDGGAWWAAVYGVAQIWT